MPSKMGSFPPLVPASIRYICRNPRRGEIYTSADKRTITIGPICPSAWTRRCEIPSMRSREEKTEPSPRRCLVQGESYRVTSVTKRAVNIIRWDGVSGYLFNNREERRDNIRWLVHDSDKKLNKSNIFRTPCVEIICSLRTSLAMQACIANSRPRVRIARAPMRDSTHKRSAINFLRI